MSITRITQEYHTSIMWLSGRENHSPGDDDERRANLAPIAMQPKFAVTLFPSSLDQPVLSRPLAPS